jgi:hypothetical protein
MVKSVPRETKLTRTWANEMISLASKVAKISIAYEIRASRAPYQIHRERTSVLMRRWNQTVKRVVAEGGTTEDIQAFILEDIKNQTSQGFVNRAREWILQKLTPAAESLVEGRDGDE